MEIKFKLTYKNNLIIELDEFDKNYVTKQGFPEAIFNYFNSEKVYLSDPVNGFTIDPEGNGCFWVTLENDSLKWEEKIRVVPVIKTESGYLKVQCYKEQ